MNLVLDIVSWALLSAGGVFVLIGGIGALRMPNLYTRMHAASVTDTIVPVVITVYQDRSFSYITKTPPASVLLLKAAGLKSGSSNPKADRVAEIGRDKIREIAELKMPDLNAYDVESAMRIIEGTARSAGITVVD